MLSLRTLPSPFSQSASVTAGNYFYAIKVLQAHSCAAVLLQPAVAADFVGGSCGAPDGAASPASLALFDALRLEVRAVAAAPRERRDGVLAAALRASCVAVACAGVGAVDAAAPGLVKAQLKRTYKEDDDTKHRRTLAGLMSAARGVTGAAGGQGVAA